MRKIDSVEIPGDVIANGQAVVMPAGAEILGIEVDKRRGLLILIIAFNADAVETTRRVYAFNLGDEIPDELMMRLIYQGVFTLSDLTERMYGFGGRRVVVFIEQDDTFWKQNPADIIYEMMKNNPRVDRAVLDKWLQGARDYFNEPVEWSQETARKDAEAGVDDPHPLLPQPRTVLFPDGEPTGGREALTQAVRDVRDEREEGAGDANETD